VRDVVMIDAYTGDEPDGIGIINMMQLCSRITMYIAQLLWIEDDVTGKSKSNKMSFF
jgi:hypothetical protein